MSETAKLLYELGVQMARFGPVLSTKMSIFSIRSLPWGLGPAGAESVKQGVDGGDPDGVARLTAIMVRLGLLGTVHDIVIALCAQDRHETVALVTRALLEQGEITVVTQITNSLIASGHSSDAVSISGWLISHGNTQISKVISETGLNMGGMNIFGGGDGNEGGDQEEEQQEDDTAEDGTEGGSGSGQGNNVFDNLKQQTAQVIEKITPPDSQKEDSSKKGKPDAESLFSDWTGVKAPTANGNTPSESKDQTSPDEEPPKEERLL